jgi:RNA polymerase sigma-70 factor (sigma-E family)
VRALVAADRDVDFDAIYVGHVARLVRLAALLGADDAEDVAQEAFCRLYAARARVREPELMAYLNRIVVNEVRSRARRRRVAAGKRHLLPVAEQSPGPTVERTAVLAEVARLPHRQREALVLRYWLDLPYDEVAEAMGVTAGTAKSQVSRGLKALSVALNEEGA